MADIVVTNTGSERRDAATFDIGVPGEIESLWRATSWTPTEAGARVTLESLDLAPGESATIRFKGAGPAEISLTGGSEEDDGSAVPVPVPVPESWAPERQGPASGGEVVEVGPGIGARALQELIDGSEAGTVIRLGAGRYSFDRTIVLDEDGVSVVGAGAGVTVIRMASGLGQEAFAVGDGGTSGRFTLADAADEGATRITLTGAHDFRPGDFVYLARESTDAFYDEIGDRTWRKDVPLRTSIVEVAEVDGRTITLASGLHFDFVPGETRVSEIALARDIALGGFAVDYGLGKADPSRFDNTLSAYDRNAVVQVEGTAGLRLFDIEARDVPSLGVNMALSREAQADGIGITGAHNKGPGGNGYALQIRDVYDSSFVNLSDLDMRHSVVFASWRSAVGNKVHVTSTDRDINFHGGRDHGNTVRVDASVRDANSDIISPTLFVNTEGTHYGSVTDAEANTVRFGKVVGTRLADDVHGRDGGAWLDGRGGHDTLTGGDGNDVLIGGAGRDVLRGGAGEDMAVYTGDRSDFRLARLSGGGWEVDDRQGGQDRDAVHGVEWLVFDDGALRLSDQAFLALDAIEDVFKGIGGASDSAPAPAPAPVETDPAPADGTGGPTLTGTDGKDRFDVTEEGTVVHGLGNWDEVRASVDFAMSADVERLELVGGRAIDGTGTASNDLILGNDAANVILGRSGDDRIWARGGDDRVDGGGGKDRLDGGGGDDVILGGLGADVLRGGGGADRFVFRSVEESARGAHDRILDFESGADVIELARIDADTTRPGHQSFAWNGTGPGRFVFENGSLRGDTDGDGRADLVIEIGPIPLGIDDLLL
ncbi:M10 family metallopeptidase C-terminal domain-containing protein [Histidinibacterium lentulum]|uniref:M10 family metallopeptidase C-terminal domain-containing protein n=1 Tax=Histidinibacterium lentulum TaxID=2480588 RepID=UPI0016190CF1|nr:M10 family metallopeptidase C-terminal domain-containing protein [Histidinibacterium lentulum]